MAEVAIGLVVQLKRAKFLSHAAGQNWLQPTLLAIPSDSAAYAFCQVVLRPIAQFVMHFLPGKYAIFTKKGYSGTTYRRVPTCHPGQRLQACRT